MTTRVVYNTPNMIIEVFTLIRETTCDCTPAIGCCCQRMQAEEICGNKCLCISDKEHDNGWEWCVDLISKCRQLSYSYFPLLDYLKCFDYVYSGLVGHCQA